VIEVAWVDPELHLEAREAVLATARHGVSLVDQVSFLVMRRRAIRTAFAFDDDFAREGFDLLPAPSAGR
jgi:predicted nucleic acid-binding protein